MYKKLEKRIRLKKKIRSKILGTKDCPRFSVFRSNARIYGQLIDDTAGVTIVSGSDMDTTSGTKTIRAKTLGASIAKMALDKGITSCVFDRNGFKYTGRVKALADSARDAGLKF